MSEIPHAVLSEAFEQRLSDRRVVAAIFTAFRFDPGFFEQEILPVFLDVPLSHAVAIRLVQLEDSLRSMRTPIAVYYDANGLVTSDAGSARLDVKRIPVRHPTGVFHPKNVLLLVEDAEPGEDGTRAQMLLVASSSANLTRAGWWENVEACHIESIEAYGKNRARDDLRAFLRGLRQRASVDEQHRALEEIDSFLGKTEMRQQRSSDGRLHTHFFSGRGDFADWIETAAGSELRGWNLEIIAPYFDDDETSAPLEDLIARFQPEEVRVLLPCVPDTGAAAVSAALYESVRAMDGVRWGRLPKEHMRFGRSEDAKERTVHAKVYRFFRTRPKREVIITGSVNLTRAAHRTGGNVESAFLVEVDVPQRPDFWLRCESARATIFEHAGEDEGATATSGSRLSVRFRWDTQIAELYWDSCDPSPALQLEAQGIVVAAVPPLPPRAWTKLGVEEMSRLRGVLDRTSFLSVVGDRSEPVTILVQEEGMSHKPSLLLQLAASDILRYWSLLSPEQKAAFLEDRIGEISGLEGGEEFVATVKGERVHESFFDRFAGVFHAFGCLERNVCNALEAENEREVEYRLFGRKYDSLSHLLDRIEGDELDAVDQYLIVLCARQLCDEIRHSYVEFWRGHAKDASELELRLAKAGQRMRSQLTGRNPADFDRFLEWFERWFVKRASLMTVES